MQVHPTAPQHVPAVKEQELVPYMQPTRMWESAVLLAPEGEMGRKLSNRFGE